MPESKIDKTIMNAIIKRKSEFPEPPEKFKNRIMKNKPINPLTISSKVPPTKGLIHDTISEMSNNMAGLNHKKAPSGANS